MERRPAILVDAGVEVLKVRYVGREGLPSRSASFIHHGQLESILLSQVGLFPGPLGVQRTCLYVTGKLSAEAAAILGCGVRILPEAALCRAGRLLLSQARDAGAVTIIDFSASGYCLVTVEDGKDYRPRVAKNPACGAGSGVNLRRVLEKLNIRLDEVDAVLAQYLGEEGAAQRAALPVRTERCGVFSVSATVSDKNQGIPVEHALAVTMKSEVQKPCNRIPVPRGRVYLTGGVFRWQFMRDCARDALSAMGIGEVLYDEAQELPLMGLEDMASNEREVLTSSVRGRSSSPKALPAIPSFQAIKERLEADGRFLRANEQQADTGGLSSLTGRPVDIALDIGSSMAKMVIAAAGGGEILYQDCIPNKGDSLLTVRAMMEGLINAGVEALPVSSFGLTGSGRYQIQKILRAVYPHLDGRIYTMVENEAHALGSLELLRRRIAELKMMGNRVNEEFGLLVDIGGEDTKVSVISLSGGALYENAMNCKCSAGTGSLMDVLQALLAIPSVEQAYSMAMQAEKAHQINATCAVFLMEEARRMQIRGVPPAEILASCCHAIVENMARTLWPQVTVPDRAVVLLHGQTMKSDPLALATIQRLETYTGGLVYGVVPPHPGHRACLGLLQRPERGFAVDGLCRLGLFTSWGYRRRLVSCPGRVCGNERMRCSRTRITSLGENPPISVTIGGCTSVNDQKSRIDRRVPDAYREIWQWVANRHPHSDDHQRLVIPRCFIVSEYALLFAESLGQLGIPVHVDSVHEDDISRGQSFFEVDTCAPTVGATGQCVRLAGSPHRLIMLPQIDFLPTGGDSLGRTCTTNQGGIWAAVQFARLRHPEARLVVVEANLGQQDKAALTRQLYRSLGEVFGAYGLDVSLSRFRQAWRFGEERMALLRGEMADLAASYLERASAEGTPVSIVCGREYLLSPGIYDQHISKMLKDKGILPIPSYAIPTALDRRFSHLYWRNSHDIATKIAAIVEGRLHEIVFHPRLRDVLRRLEKGDKGSALSHAVVTTFRCGPDSVAAHLLQEISRRRPFLWLQSDGTIAELAHLENRISTHMRRLEMQQRAPVAAGDIPMEAIRDFELTSLNPQTDVVYFPTLADNRVMTSLVRALGITAVDNYRDETYDLEAKGKLGRRYVGEEVCFPLAAVFADMLAAVDDFRAKKASDDPLYRDKKRLVIFMHGGDGPCRLGQYIHVFKVAFLRVFGGPDIAYQDRQGRVRTFRLQLLENITAAVGERGNLFSLFDPWALILGYQGLVAHGLCYSLFLKAASFCRDEASFLRLTEEFGKFKDALWHHIELRAAPGRVARACVRRGRALLPFLAGPIHYVGYGLWRNFGLRRLFYDFAKRWMTGGPASRPIRIHVDGEVYMRTCQAEAILRILTEHLGYGVFEMTLTPTWSYFEGVLHTRILDARSRLADLQTETAGEGAAIFAAACREQRRLIGEAATAIRRLREILARPLYRAARVEMPHPMVEVYAAAAPIIPTGKPYGELVPFVGEAILQCRQGTDLILNVLPQGCMVSQMGEMLVPSILALGGGEGRTTIAAISSREGEVDEQQLRFALVKALGERWSGVLPNERLFSSI